MIETTTLRFRDWFSPITSDSVSMPTDQECFRFIDAFGPNGYQIAIINVCDNVRTFTVDFEGPRRFFFNIVGRRRGGLNGRPTYWRNTVDGARAQWTV